eukprot:TRINITY_DN723_c0_g1_i1.p3 TRINITY_DN723_c0_g1~~TRINITY_DN723_c0_g1_i1.p3  ORF type:complete len:165 (+),score=44.36 TRINITY_DN723_c0_g1_i1:637-1131(+)
MFIGSVLPDPEDARDSGLDILSLSNSVVRLSPSYVAQAQAVGLQVMVWTVNSVADIDAALSWGVDGIISDYPDRVIEQRGQYHVGAAPPPHASNLHAETAAALGAACKTRKAFPTIRWGKFLLESPTCQMIASQCKHDNFDVPHSRCIRLAFQLSQEFAAASLA